MFLLCCVAIFVVGFLIMAGAKQLNYDVEKVASYLTGFLVFVVAIPGFLFLKPAFQPRPDVMVCTQCGQQVHAPRN